MPFKFTDQHITDYYHHGYTVFRGIVPPKLIDELRVMADAGRPIARERGGPQAQRLQPLEGSGLDLSAYRKFLELPDLVDAIQRVLTKEHALAGAPRAAIFYEPADLPCLTGWHRDITAQAKGVDSEEFAVISRDPTFFAQINCALYTDCCTWYVPGSVNRPNTAGEIEAVSIQVPLEGRSYAERERMALDYCNAMPGAIQLLLEPGDFALYQPNAWHLGNYAPHRKRATFTDSVWNNASRAWYDKWLKTFNHYETTGGDQ